MTVKRRVLAVTMVAGVLCAGVMAAAANAATAPGAPGSESYFDLARKDCVGTARNTTSRVWFTVADGVLSDTYWPNVDATNVHRPADPRHELPGHPRPHGHVVHDRRLQRRAPLLNYHDVHCRSGAQRG